METVSHPGLAITSALFILAGFAFYFRAIYTQEEREQFGDKWEAYLAAWLVIVGLMVLFS